MAHESSLKFSYNLNQQTTLIERNKALIDYNERKKVGMMFYFDVEMAIWKREHLWIRTKWGGNGRHVDRQMAVIQLASRQPISRGEKKFQIIIPDRAGEI